jgi:hypothetical protein
MMNSDWIDGNQNFDKPADTLDCYEYEMAQLAKARREGRMIPPPARAGVPVAELLAQDLASAGCEQCGGQLVHKATCAVAIEQDRTKRRAVLGVTPAQAELYRQAYRARRRS